MHPVNDGTNACAFLTLKIAEFLLEYEQDGKQYDNFSTIKPIIENLIFCTPMRVNPIRDVDSYYDTKTAHELMLNKKFIRKFSFTTLIDSTDIYSIENQSVLNRLRKTKRSCNRHYFTICLSYWKQSRAAFHNRYTSSTNQAWREQ